MSLFCLQDAGGRCSMIGTLLGAFVLSRIQSDLVIRAIEPLRFILFLGLILILVSLANRGLAAMLIELAKSGAQGRRPVAEPANSGESGGKK